MKRILVCLALVFTMIFSCGCSQNYEIDMQKFCGDVVENVKFASPLGELNENVAKLQYAVPEGTEFYVFYGSSTYSDCFCIFKAEEKSDREAILETINSKKESLVSTYESYAPDEVKKIENSYLEEKGNYIIFAITDDKESLKEIVKEYF